ncbi:unnamed protein product [Rhizophagus irregularis]|nr:unnamed protein product [Rhizophagus irregularis]
MYLIIFSYSFSYSFSITIRSIYLIFGLILNHLNMTRHNTSHTEKYNTSMGNHRQEMQDEQIIADETTITAKSKKKDFIERNKQTVQSTSKSTFSKRPREDSPSSQNSRQSSSTKTDKKKNHGVPSSSTHSNYSRSSEIALREEVKKLKRNLLERDDWLREKEAELLDAEDIVDALQERVREVEARNRELQRENEIMRNYIEEENAKKTSPANEFNIYISSMMNEIRGEPASLERVQEVEDHLQKENEFTNYTEERNGRN